MQGEWDTGWESAKHGRDLFSEGSEKLPRQRENLVRGISEEAGSRKSFLARGKTSEEARGSEELPRQRENLVRGISEEAGSRKSFLAREKIS